MKLCRGDRVRYLGPTDHEFRVTHGQIYTVAGTYPEPPMKGAQPRDEVAIYVDDPKDDVGGVLAFPAAHFVDAEPVADEADIPVVVPDRAALALALWRAQAELGRAIVQIQDAMLAYPAMVNDIGDRLESALAAFHATHGPNLRAVALKLDQLTIAAATKEVP